ncbi:hypothetical protein OAH93_01630 [Flavobacteriales bacterium]|nr:hypothetical protein [Flavobacteriales bacterium]
MATYVEFIGSGDYTGTNAGIIRDWANRDVSVLSNSVVSRCLNYAADEAYKTLRVPPLEFTRTYVVNGTQEEITSAGSSDLVDISPSAFQGGGNILTITAPSDMIEVIYIRNSDTATKNVGIVYNEKVDSRTFNDGFTQTKDFHFYTRIGNDYKLHGKFKRGDEVDVHYYRRLPGLNATYSATFNNWVAGVGTLDIGGTATTYANASSPNNTESSFNTRVGSNASYWVGDLAPHWLRDENERILLFGALKQIFIYLNDNPEIEKYQALFGGQIEAANKEETARRARGGNIAISFAGTNLI